MTSVTDLAKERKIARLIDRLGEHLADHPEIADRTFSYLAGELPMKRGETVMISIRIPPDLLAEIDAIAREMAYHESRKVTRNSLIVELLRHFVEQRSAQKE